MTSGNHHRYSPADAGYPDRLLAVGDAPGTLYVLGTVVDAELSVAIVGARAASGHCMEAARSIAEELAGAGALIVSGGAVGVDSAAHRGALAAGGSTVAVLGSGLDVAYPARSRPLFADIAAAGGGLVSPFAPGVPPRPGCFVRRNRVIAGMADAAIVIGAGSGSGALYTAAAARDYGRCVGAFPGTPGCEQLIARGAAVIETASDLFEALAGRPRRPVIALPDPGTSEAQVLSVLDDAPADEEQIAERTGLGLRDVTRALTGLELEGLALVTPARSFVRSTLAQELTLR